MTHNKGAPSFACVESEGTEVIQFIVTFKHGWFPIGTVGGAAAPPTLKAQPHQHIALPYHVLRDFDAVWFQNSGM